MEMMCNEETESRERFISLVTASQVCQCLIISNLILNVSNADNDIMLKSKNATKTVALS